MRGGPANFVSRVQAALALPWEPSPVGAARLSGKSGPRRWRGVNKAAAGRRPDADGWPNAARVCARRRARCPLSTPGAAFSFSFSPCRHVLLSGETRALFRPPAQPGGCHRQKAPQSRMVKRGTAALFAPRAGNLAIATRRSAPRARADRMGPANDTGSPGRAAAGEGCARWEFRGSAPRVARPRARGALGGNFEDQRPGTRSHRREVRLGRNFEDQHPGPRACRRGVRIRPAAQNRPLWTASFGRPPTCGPVCAARVCFLSPTSRRREKGPVAAQYFPVEPKPPAPRAVSSSASSTKAGAATGAMTICAMRSPGSMV